MRWVKLGVLAAAAAGTIAWMSYVPYDGARLVRAVPSGARWVSRHRHVAARWPDLSESLLVRLSGRLAGAKETAWRNLIGSASARWWVDRIADREVWLFDLPGRSGGYAIGGAAWMGGRATRWRLAFQAGQVAGFDRLGEYRGRTMWVLRQPLDENGVRLALAIEEGVLLACLSLTPSDLYHVLDAYDGVAGRWGPAAMLRDVEESDAALGRWDTGELSVEWLVGLQRVDARHVDGWFVEEGWPLEMPPSALEATPTRPRLATVIERQAAVSVRAAPSAADALLAPLLSGWAADLWRLLRDSTAGPVHAAVFGDPLYGRVRGLRVPGFAVSLPLRDPVDFSARLDDWLDRWNTARRWGLIRGPMPGTPRLTMVEGTDSGPYRGLPGGECVGYLIEDGWLTAAPSADTLRMLLAIEAASDMSAPRRPWPARSDGVEFRLDSGRLVEVVRLGLSVYSLLRLVADADGSAAERRRLEQVADAIGVLADLGSAKGEITGEGRRLRIDFRFRPGAAADPAIDTMPGKS